MTKNPKKNYEKIRFDTNYSNIIKHFLFGYKPTRVEAKYDNQLFNIKRRHLEKTY